MKMIANAAARTQQTTEDRPEMETYKRENREREIEVISVDKGYKPKVTTWGVFERPSDISATYGGGRNIKPGQPLETAEQSKARLDRVRDAVSVYRKKVGYDVDVENVAAVEEAISTGVRLMETGRLEGAAARLQEAVEMAPMMSDLGGQARLQLALALDSLNRSEEAKKLYQLLGRHPNIDVQKRANRMLWGMTTASEFMRADKISFNAGMREYYSRFFDTQINAWDVYTASNAEEERQLQILSTVITVSLFVLPVGLFLALRFGSLS